MPPKSPSRPSSQSATARPTLAVVEQPVDAAPPTKAAGMKLKDLVERVAASTGARKSEAKASVEATLAVLAEALEAGTELAVPPLGKLRVTRRSGPVLVLKLRRKGEAGDDAKAGAKPLAEDGEDD